MRHGAAPSIYGGGASTESLQPEAGRLVTGVDLQREAEYLGARSVSRFQSAVSAVTLGKLTGTDALYDVGRRVDDQRIQPILTHSGPARDWHDQDDHPFGREVRLIGV